GAPAADKAGLDNVLKRLGSLENAIAKLKTPDSTSSRVALSPPSPTPLPTGRGGLTNMHYQDVLFVINQKTHQLAPGAAATIDPIPAGVLTYEAISPTWGLVQPLTNRNLLANETFTLTAR